MNKKAFIISLLVAVTIVTRLMYVHQTDFDSYWIHGMSESINIYGHAKWVFHPASLFGYYPLSYPSGLMFLLAHITELTGLGMGDTILITGLFFGILGTLMVFALGEKLGGFRLGVLSAFIFTLSPQIIYYSSNIASGRYLLILFYLFLIFLMTEVIKRMDMTFRTFDWSLCRYCAMLVVTLIIMFSIHRTAQLAVFFIAAFFATVLFYLIKAHGHDIISNKLTKLVLRRYKDKMKIIYDAAAVVIVLGVLKAADLLIRGRFMINVQRMLAKFKPIVNIYNDYQTATIAVVVIMALILIALAIFAFRKRKSLLAIYDFIYVQSIKDPERYFFILMLLIASALFVMQFFGKSFYSPSLDEYASSDILQGDNPLFIFINFIVNYSTSVSVVSIFGLIGLGLMCLKRKRSPQEIFFIFISIAFIGILIDKRYVRLFVTPLLAIFCGYGMFSLYERFETRRITKQLMAICIVMISLFAFTSQAREVITEKPAAFPFEYEFWNTGIYIKQLDCNCSTVTTAENIAGVTIFASSGVPGGSHNIYYYVNKTYIQPEPLNRSQVIDRLKAGEKVTNLWRLPDWIYGGQYYHGRHTRNLFGTDYRQKNAQRIIEDYNEEFYIHDKSQEATRFYLSIEPVFNKVYDNPGTDVHDLTKGWAQ